MNNNSNESHSSASGSRIETLFCCCVLDFIKVLWLDPFYDELPYHSNLIAIHTTILWKSQPN